MSKLEESVHGSYEDLFSVDGEGATYDDPSHMAGLLSPRIVDESTLSAIDVKDLFNAINHTRTRTGAATLFRSLVNPLDSLELILEKQNSLKELEKDRKKREALNGYLNSLAKREQYVHRYLFQCSYSQNEPFNLRFVDQYKLYHESTEFFKNMVDGVKDLPSLESPYIRILVEDIRSIDEKRAFELVKGPVYKTLGGLETKKEVRIYTPRVKFTLRSFKPTLAIPYVAFFSLAFVEPLQIPAVLGVILYTPFIYGFPETFDRRYFVSPLKEIYKEDPDIGRGIEALGMIDELMSFHKYSKAMGRDMILPTMTHANKHHFVATKARNPILAKGNPDYVPNDVNLNEQRLTILTGANSGGKTTYCKTIAQMQLLAQIGCYVPAEEAELSIADRILYQAPTFDSIRDAEGRFGTELGRTRDIFFKATPRSLVILDELAEATTYEEKMEISYVILNGFNKIGSDTILVTHNHELARKLQQEGKSQNLQVEFKNRKPTYKITPGISKESHAELIAEKMGFSSKDIDSYLKRKGYSK
jgi:DNA mismatch repair protein MutS